jgi:hypothetical protein
MAAFFLRQHSNVAPIAVAHETESGTLVAVSVFERPPCAAGSFAASRGGEGTPFFHRLANGSDYLAKIVLQVF